MAQRNIQFQDITKRFGVVSLGLPQKVTAVGLTSIYTPAAGKKIRLKWFAMASPDTNTASVIATVALAGVDIYIWPMGAPGAFMHSSVREGITDGELTITLSEAGQDIYVNMDIEEF